MDCGYDADAKDEETGVYEKAQGWYVVCEYAPAGNVVGRNKKWFKMNVKPAGKGSESGSWGGGHGEGSHGSGGHEKDNGGVAARGYVGRVGFWLMMVHGIFFML